VSKKSNANPTGYSSGNADAGDLRCTNPEPAQPKPAPLRHVAANKRGYLTLFEASIRIKGELSGDEDLTIQGHVERTIELKQNNLTVGAQGSIKAISRARIISAEGKLEGDLYGQERVVIRQAMCAATS
jgi:cytoskeletal protein CcmA (bactofilin family)